MPSLNTAPVFQASASGETSGKVLIDIAGKYDSASSLTVQVNPDNQQDYKILVTGTSTTAGYNDFSVIRLNADGTLDKTFSLDGKASFDIGGHTDGVVA